MKGKGRERRGKEGEWEGEMEVRENGVEGGNICMSFCLYSTSVCLSVQLCYLFHVHEHRAMLRVTGRMRLSGSKYVLIPVFSSL